MKAENMVEILKNKKGQHVAVTWSRQAKTRKGVEMVIAKRTTAHVRSGIDFANLATVKSGIESGERGEVQAIWKGAGEWAQFPFIIRHKVTGATYLRLYPSAFANLVPSVEWTMNGKPCTKADCEPHLLASELRDNEDAPECFTVKAESVIEIDGERI